VSSLFNRGRPHLPAQTLLYSLQNNRFHNNNTHTVCTGGGQSDVVELSLFYPNHFCINDPTKGSRFLDKTVPRFNEEQSSVKITT
jgi:hypothetical protein